MSRIVIVLSMLVASLSVSAQCFIKSTDQSSGHITYYLDPELVAQTDQFGAAFSVQMVGSKYYLAITYQFANKAVPLEEKVGIELKNGYILELEMYTMQVGSAGGVELTMAVYNMEDDQINYFSASELSKVHFRDQNGQKFELPVTSNPSMLIRQLKCFGK